MWENVFPAIKERMYWSIIHNIVNGELKETKNYIAEERCMYIVVVDAAYYYTIWWYG